VSPLLPFSSFSSAACFLLYSKYQICSNSAVLQIKHLTYSASQPINWAGQSPGALRF